MKLHNLDSNNSVLNNFISEIRDITIQKDSMRFRRNIERIGEILSYELSKELNFSYRNIVTPLGVKRTAICESDIVLASILRAGLPLHQGVLNYFDQIENAFISAYRHHTSETEFEIIVEYLAAPCLDDKVLILADPMLATGKSLIAVYNALKKLGKMKQVHIISVVGSIPGIDFIEKHFPENTHLWVATIDEKLNDQGYIVPGIGDAGDLAFGEKLSH